MPAVVTTSVSSILSCANVKLTCVSEERARLIGLLEEQYRRAGWQVERGEDGTLRASGPGGVTWIGAAVTSEDLESGELEARLLELSDTRMAGRGELCPLDLLPEPACADRLRHVLDRLGLSDRPHISLYSLAAAA